MTPSVALVLFLAWVAAGLVVERRERREMVTRASWLPTIWIGICASRSVSQWLGISGGGAAEAGSAYANVSGSPVDQLVLGALVLLGLVVLARRPSAALQIIRSNKAILLFALYLGATAAWSGCRCRRRRAGAHRT